MYSQTSGHSCTRHRAKQPRKSLSLACSILPMTQLNCQSKSIGFCLKEPNLPMHITLPPSGHLSGTFIPSVASIPILPSPVPHSQPSRRKYRSEQEVSCFPYTIRCVLQRNGPWWTTYQ